MDALPRKIFAATFLVAVLSIPMSASAVLLNQYDSAVIEFDSLLLTDTASSSTTATRVALLFGDGFDDKVRDGESLRVEFFHDTPTGALISTWDIPNGGAGLAIYEFSSPTWWDLEGAIKFTMLEGSADIDHVNIDVIIGSNKYEGTFTPTIATVPIPAAVWLFGSGLVGLIGIAKRKKV